MCEIDWVDVGVAACSIKVIFELTLIEFNCYDFFGFSLVFGHPLLREAEDFISFFVFLGTQLENFKWN